MPCLVLPDFDTAMKLSVLKLFKRFTTRCDQIAVTDAVIGQMYVSRSLKTYQNPLKKNLVSTLQPTNPNVFIPSPLDSNLKQAISVFSKLEHPTREMRVLD